METPRKFFICLSLCWLTLCWSTPADAQRVRWWKDERFQKELALTTEQSDRLEAIFQAAQPALRAQHRALSKLEDELDKLILDAKLQEVAVEHFVGRVEAARADLGKARTMMFFRMRRVLSTEQHIKLQKLFEEHEKERRGRSHGPK